VHLIGAGGIGLSSVGKLLLQKGVLVSGSDQVSSDITNQLIDFGAKILIGHDASAFSNPDFVIYSDAVPEDNPERQAAAKQGIKQMSYFQFLGQLSSSYKTIVVSGTHGKSTTTAMLGLILEDAGLDPTVIVGTKVPGWEFGNLRIGAGEYFVVEGCEHMAHMLELNPNVVVLTNIEAEHLDYYRDLEHIRDTFQEFVDKVPKNGFVVRNADDPESMKLKIQTKELVYSSKDKPDDLQLQVPGGFNVANAMAAMRTAVELGVDPQVVEKSLSEFPGVWRRFERVGQFQGAEIISDYAHHPTEIQKTLEATKEEYPDQRLLVCFQPHQHSRTKELFEDFIDAFDSADELIVSEIYGVVGRTEDDDISSRDLVYAIQDFDVSQGKSREVAFAEDLNQAECELRNRVQQGDLVIIMGAGDIDQVARKLF
ncbi:MAG: UDP-N-acetylmuramate--L-alanine ligase, partial [Candidatus Uhrbacteria bacterium]